MLLYERVKKTWKLHYMLHYIVKLLIDDDPTLALMINKAEESPLFLAVDREFYDIAWEILKLEKQTLSNLYDI